MKITRPQDPGDFANTSLAQDALCCAERKAPGFTLCHRRVSLHSYYFWVVCCAFWNVVLSQSVCLSLCLSVFLSV